MSTKKQIEEELRLCQQRIVDIFEFLPTATFTLDLDKCVTSWNKALERMTGIPAAQMLGKGDYAYSIPFFGEAIPHLIDFLFRIDEDMTTRFPNVINEEGSLLTEVFCPALYNKRGAWISAKASPLLDQFGNIKGAIGSFHDISKRKLAESSLKESEEKFRAYIEKAPLAIFVVDAKGNYVDVNAEACKMTGYSREELLKITIAEFLAPESIGEGLKLFERVNKAGFAQGELIGCKKNSSKYNVDLVSVKIRNNCFLAFCVDITAKKRNMDQVLYLSYHDSLTGLYNRRFYEEELKRLDTRRNLPLSIIMGDVNGLKLINDSFGHETGDLLLKKAAEAIKKGCRADDIIARIGGDEFVILLPQTGSVEAESIVKRINSISSKDRVGELAVSISFGYKTKHNMEEIIQDVLKSAENRMYSTKLSDVVRIKSKAIDTLLKTLYKNHSREQLHSIRVSQYSEAIAIYQNLDEQEVEQIRLGGLLHDIGKIEIEDNILLKPGILNDDEMTTIRKHSEIGSRILSFVDDFAGISLDILSHHERWDGKGYPNGLTGNKIPLHARIICVADSYDAMTTYRSYKKVLTQEEAIEELILCSGKQFDPEIVKCFIEKVLGNSSIPPEKIHDATN